MIAILLFLILCVLLFGSSNVMGCLWSLFLIGLVGIACIWFIISPTTFIIGVVWIGLAVGVCLLIDWNNSRKQNENVVVPEMKKEQRFGENGYGEFMKGECEKTDGFNEE
jgi:hypothetical protein